MSRLIYPNFSTAVVDDPPVENIDPRQSWFSYKDADPIIKTHATHWLMCIETYQTNRFDSIGNWSIDYSDIETCIYTYKQSAIIGFRGTKSPKDLYDDILIIQGKIFPRAMQAIKFVKELVKLNPRVTFQLTGHSLGGAIARAVSKQLFLEAITFNAAAPPSNPVTQAPGETAYHIVFDIISAWQSPNTIRIDKGIQPVSTPWLTTISSYVWMFRIFDSIIPAHALKNFSNGTPGKKSTPCAENKLLNQWLLSLPLSGRLYILSHLNGPFSISLPSLVV